MGSATRALVSVVGLFFLFVAAVLGMHDAGAAPFSARALDDATVAPTITPVDLRGCQVGGRQADYGQTWQGLTIVPYQQRDVGGYDLWETTWRVWGPAGQVVEAEVVTYRCIGLTRTPEWDHCSAGLASETLTQTVSVTIPASGVTAFSVTSPVNCCEIDENDLMRVNGIAWGASFFVRWAESRLCPFPGPSHTPTTTSTPTPSATPSVTATGTATPTATATPPFRKWPWHQELYAGHSQRYNISMQNTSASVMPGVVVTDVLPYGVRFSDATIVLTGTAPAGDFAWYASGGAWDGQRTIVWRVGDLPAGYYATMKVQVYAQGDLQPGAILTNTALLSMAGQPALSTSATSIILAGPTTPTPRASPTFTPTPLCSPVALALVDAGGAAVYTDTQGLAWQPDRAYEGGANAWGYVGASAVYTTTDQVWGTLDGALYKSERFWTDGAGGYRFVVANGDYEVLLKFAEIYPGTVAGTRIFSVQVEGVTVAADLDVVQMAGPFVAYDLRVPVHVGDGMLSVDLLAQSNLPALKAIAVLAPRACTPTATPSATASSSATASATATASTTASRTASPTETATATETPPATLTATVTLTATPTSIATATPTHTPSASTTATATETTTPLSPTATITRLATKTATAVPTETATPTATGNPAPATASPTATSTATPTTIFHVVVMPIIVIGGE